MLTYLALLAIGFIIGWVLHNAVYEQNSELNMNELAAQLRRDYHENLKPQSEMPDVDESIRKGEAVHHSD